MKSLLLLSFLFLTSGSFFAQSRGDTTIAPQAQTFTLTELLTAYYGIKDALVIGSKDSAAASATEFFRLSSAITHKAINEDLRTHLQAEASAISFSTDINTQREAFSRISLAMFKLAKTVSLTIAPLYVHYYRKRRFYWLSNSKIVLNPYSSDP